METVKIEPQSSRFDDVIDFIKRLEERRFEEYNEEFRKDLPDALFEVGNVVNDYRHIMSEMKRKCLALIEVELLKIGRPVSKEELYLTWCKMKDGEIMIRTALLICDEIYKSKSNPPERV
ncbi:MAG: hypothetical protein JWQ40_5057 [Segetibacter sp.]|jgi:hypothetical protein|nr:hypothetical protein [Segetibacter sp.]